MGKSLKHIDGAVEECTFYAILLSSRGPVELSLRRPNDAETPLI